MKLSEKIQKINQKGIENLNTKGISIPEDSTTDTIIDNILNIVNGGESVVYSNIVYNDDNTITLIDDKGNIHTMSCIYEGDKIVSISYDGENVDLEFSGETLVNVGGTHIDISKAPTTSGGGVELNITYGDTEPDDTSKLWIKANEPESIVIGKDFEGVESIETIGNLPTATYGMGCARVGNKVYLFGGYGSSNLNTINVLNLDTQEITTLETTLPTATYSMGCASIGTKIYLFGGSKLNTINVFDTETQTITTLDVVLPDIRYNMGCASIGTKIYLFGGTSGSANSTIFVFDTETQTITTLSTTLPTICSSMGCASIGTKIYLFGGFQEGYGGARSNTISVFDTETQTITTLSTTLPTPCMGMGCANVGNKVYLFGGYGLDTSKLNTINVFDIETQTITTLSTTLPTVCYNMGCASVGNKIYLFGGYGSSKLNTINKFTLTHDLAQNNIEVITDYKNFFNIVNTDTMKVEIGVNSILIGNAENQAENCEAYLYQNDAWVQI